MPQPVDYPTFLANVQKGDLAMLTAFVTGARVEAADAAEADQLFARANRLYNAGLLVELHRVYFDRNGVVRQAFDGFVNSVAKAHLAQLARERVALSRDPIPEPEEPQP